MAGMAEAPLPRVTDKKILPEAGLTFMSLIVTSPDMAPSSELILFVSFSTLTAALESPLVSPVPTAKIVADVLSPMNRMPSGPKANCAADFSSGVPFLRLSVNSAARVDPVNAATSPKAAMIRVMRCISLSLPSRNVKTTLPGS